MRILNSSSHLKSLILAMGSAVLLISSAQAAVIWSDDFSGSARGTAPNPYDFAGGASGNDYTVVAATGVTYTAAGGPSGFLNIADTSTTGTPTATVFANQFASTSYASGTQFTLSFDIRVNSLLAAAPASAPRFSIVNGAGGVEVFTIGFSHENFTGAVAGSDALGFYFVNDTAGTAIDPTKGIGVGTFNFGQYSTTTAANNDTNVVGSGGASFFRVSLTLTEGSQAVTGSITDLGSTTVALFPGTTALKTALNWSGSASNDGFRFVTGVSGTSNYDIDNISVSAVPEPTAVLIGTCSLLVLLARRRR